MSFPFNAKVSRASNGSIEFMPDNPFDLNKLQVGESVVVDAADAPKPSRKARARKAAPARESAVPVKKVGRLRKAAAKKESPKDV